MNGYPRTPIGQWPPEVPPLHPPVPPTEPVPPGPQPLPTRPSRMLPTWDEPDPRVHERELAERLLEHRIIMVGGSLDETVADRVSAQLLLLGRSQQPIELHLSCADSELGAALSVADAVDLVAAPVHALVRGLLKGPAVAVLCAARQRLAHRNALFVLSLPSVSGEGTGEALAKKAEQHQRQVEQLRGRLASVTGRDVGELAADIEAGRLLTAEEALAYGLIQELR
jgi:ATP-dependent Clp protease protease subunit